MKPLITPRKPITPQQCGTMAEPWFEQNLPIPKGGFACPVKEDPNPKSERAARWQKRKAKKGRGK